MVAKMIHASRQGFNARNAGSASAARTPLPHLKPQRHPVLNPVHTGVGASHAPRNVRVCYKEAGKAAVEPEKSSAASAPAAPPACGSPNNPIAPGKAAGSAPAVASPSLNAVVDSAKAAQEIYSHFTQEQVDHIFKEAATAANQARIPLARMAVQETGMGLVEDKVLPHARL